MTEKYFSAEEEDKNDKKKRENRKNRQIEEA